MYRIDNDTAGTSLPTPQPVGPKPNGYFISRDASTGIKPTIVDTDWANAVQEEICRTIEGAGLTLSKTNQSQLLAAVKVIAQGASTTNYAVSSSTANTYVASFTPAYVSLTPGDIFYVKCTNGNTGSSTMDVGAGAKNIKLTNGTSLSGGEIPSNGIAILQWDGTNLQLLNPSLSSQGFYTDTGSANTYVITPSPAIGAYAAGIAVTVKIANTNTSSTTTLNVNGLGAKTIKLQDGTTPYLGAMLAAGIYNFIYDGTNFQLLNPTPSIAMQNNVFSYVSDTGSTNTVVVTMKPAITVLQPGMMVRVLIANTNTAVNPTLNVNGLGATSIICNSAAPVRIGDIVAGRVSEFVFNSSSVFELLNPATRIRFTNVQTFPAGAFTYTPTPGMVSCFARMVGGGGGGGGFLAQVSGTNGSGGGGAGGFLEALLTAAQIGASKTGTVGAGGTAGSTSGGNGGAGGNTNLGTLLTANGGSGGTGSSGSTSAATPAGGTGGSASVTTGQKKITVTGGTGSYGAGAGTVNFSLGGAGAPSPIGAGGIGGVIANAGGNGFGFGSGGGGAAGNTSGSALGGVGGDGYLEITELCA